jgi:hypothetical protein
MDSAQAIKEAVGDLALRWTGEEYCNHRLSINRPTKRGKENSRFDGHC